MKRKGFRKGKTFYSILRLLLIFINVPILISLIFTQRALKTSHDAIQTMLAATQEVQMQYIQAENPGRNHMDQLTTLQSYTELQTLGQFETLVYNEQLKQAEDILLSVTPSYSENGQITTYLYFPNSNYLIDSSQLGKNAVGSVDPLIFSGLDGGDSDTADVPRVFLYKDTHSIYTASVYPGVIFIFDIFYSYDYPTSNRPDLYLSADLAESLNEVELCYYDSYGNMRLISGKARLVNLYDYTTIGPDSNSSFSFEYEGHFYLCHYVFNEYNMNKYALFCRDEIAEEQYKTSILIWISGGVLVLAFLACAIVYTRRTYRPFSSLLARLDDHEADMRDEFAVLNRAIDTFDDRLSEQGQLLKKYYLLRVLRGQRTDFLEDCQDDWFSDQNGASFAVAALYVDEMPENKLREDPLLENAALTFFTSDGWNIRTVADGDFLFLAFRLLPQVEASDLASAFQRFQQKLQDSYISAYISNIHDSAKELRRCYNEAMAVSEYFLANGSANIITTYNDTPQIRLKQGTASPDFGQLNKLSDCITTLESDEALLVYDSLTEQLAQTGGQPLDADNPLYNMLVGTIILALYDIDLPGESGRLITQNIVNTVRRASSVAQLRQCLNEGFQTLCKKADREEYDYQRFGKIRDYIQEHYSDPNLDATSIAEIFQVSPSTITRLFKKYNHTGFLEFVHQTRVKEATELLINTDLPISEISSKVGYTNAATMNRAFRAHAKSTPSMIRKAASD